MRARALRGGLAALLACGALAAPASAVTITLGPPDLSGGDPFAECGVDNSCATRTFIPTAAPGATLLAPADGTITSWRVRGVLPRRLRLRVVSAAGGGQFRGVMTSGVAAGSDGAGSTPAAIGIKAGQQLGIDLQTDFPNGSTSSAVLGAPLLGGAWSEYAPGLADNTTATPTGAGAGAVPMFNATVELIAPEIVLMTSTQGPSTGGDVVALTGAHLAVVTSVTFGGVGAEVIRADGNQVVVAAPPHPPGPVEVVLTTAGGSAAGRYEYVAPAGPARDGARPTLRGLAISPGAFRAIVGAQKAIVARRGKRLGARVSYRAGEAVRTKFTVERARRGRGGRARYVKTPGSFVHAGKVGPNKFRFTGRVGGELLSPGRYRLVAVATDAAGNRSKKPLRRSFRILGRVDGGK